MKKAKRVLVIIALTVTIIQIAGDIVKLLHPPKASMIDAYAARGEEAIFRITVYWVMGAFILFSSQWVRRSEEFLADCLAIGGVYLMVLGANGGLLSIGSGRYELAAAFANLGILSYLATRLERRERGAAQDPA